MKPQLVHVGIRATNLDRSVRFWRDVLGLVEVDRGDNRVDLTDGRHNFRLFSNQGAERPANPSGLLAYIHIGVRVPDLEAALERFVRAGVPIEVDDVRGGRPYDPENPPTESFKVSDPDGIVIDVTASDEQWPGVGRLL